MPDPVRFTPEQMLTLANTAIHKVDLLGERGATLCSQNEIIAMAATIVFLRDQLAGQSVQIPVQTPVEGTDQ